MKITLSILLLCTISLFAEHSENRPLSVLIIGGGPAGLATGIQAKESGCSVTLVEKRNKYSRLQLLGLWDESIQLLKKWDVNIPEMQIFDLPEDRKEGNQIGLVPIKNLEERLQKKCEELGLQRVEGCFLDLGANHTAIIQTEEEQLVLPYDILVGADGTHSSVAKALEIEKNTLASASGAIILIPPEPLAPSGLSPVLQYEQEFLRIFNFYSWMKVIGMQSPSKCSKSHIREFFKTQGMTQEVRAIDKGYAWILEDIPILLTQAQTFSNEEKFAILIGDAAASASFIRGRGANTALKSAEIAGRLFKKLQTDSTSPFQKFNESMQEITDKEIMENLFLFNYKSYLIN